MSRMLDGTVTLPAAHLGAGEALLRDELHELRIISTFCANVAAYTVHGTLGTGQNGMVLDVSVRPEFADGLPRADAHYALKVCFNFGVPTTQVRNAFVNEFNVLARLPAHRNVVRFLCQFVAPVDAAVAAVLPLFAREIAVETLRDGSLRYHSTQFFVLERLSTTLQTYLRGVRGLVPLALAQRILGDVGAALRHLQLSAVVHLDVKPDNVLVELERGSDQLTRCVLADFGTAQRTRDGCVDLSVDASGNLLSPDWGNMAHLAPEVLNARAAAVRAGRAHTVRVDMRGQAVFELAVMAYEVVLGGHPLGSYPLACTDVNGVVAYAQSAVSALPAGGCPAPLEAMLRRALAPDPALRPDLPELLECIATSTRPAATQTPQPPPPTPPIPAPRAPTPQPPPPSPAPQSHPPSPAPQPHPPCPAPPPPPPTLPGAEREVEWPCTACTLLNSPQHTSCQVCHAPRVDATEAPCATVGSPRTEGRRRGVVRDGAAFVRTFGSKGAGDRNFNAPRHVCVDGDNLIIVVDCDNHRIVVVARTDGSFVRTFGSKGAAHGQFKVPDGVCVNAAGLIIVADSGNDRVQMFTRDGTFVRAFGSCGAAPGQFFRPCGVCVDGDDNIVVADTCNNRIQVFSSDGTAVLRTLGTRGQGAGQLNWPEGVCVDGGGNIVVADTRNHRIQQFRADGTFVRAFGSCGIRGPAQFQYPRGVCVDGAANIFVVDSVNNRIQQFRSDGTFVRAFGSYGSGPAQFNCPFGVCVGADGALFVADSCNHRIHEYL